MTVDELISEVSRRGLRLNNLFQTHDGRWQANITDSERFWEFGKGDSATEALQAALNISSTTTPTLGIKQTNRLARPLPPPAPAPAPTIATEVDEEIIGSI